MLSHPKVSSNELSICLLYHAFFHFWKPLKEPSSFQTFLNSFKSDIVSEEKVFVTAPQRGSVDLQLAVLPPLSSVRDALLILLLLRRREDGWQEDISIPAVAREPVSQYATLLLDTGLRRRKPEGRWTMGRQTRIGETVKLMLHGCHDAVCQRHGPVPNYLREDYQ